MDLQSLFYLLAIIIMSFVIIGIIAIIFLVIRIRQKAAALKNHAFSRAVRFVGERNELAAVFGMVLTAIAQAILRRRGKKD